MLNNKLLNGWSLFSLITIPISLVVMTAMTTADLSSATGRAWYLDDTVQVSPGEEIVRSVFLRPALDQVFETQVLRYSTESQNGISVTAGRLMSNAHYEAAMNSAKRRAAARELRGVGIPALAVEDIIESLYEEAHSAARRMSADHGTLARELDVPGHITRTELVSTDEPRPHRYLQAP